MKLEDYNFELPKQLIAQTPASPRNHSRLLVYDRSNNSIIDDYFYNLEKYLLPETTIVLNNSKVEKSRLRFGSAEIFILETINPTTIRALVRPGRRFKKHTIQQFTLFQGPSLETEVMDVDEDGIRTLKLNIPVDDVRLDKHRLTPLPPYIAQDEKLADGYQTVYAQPLGSKAAPTAGLHFTNEQLIGISLNHQIAKLTLHVGMGTFAPVKADNIESHKMHSEKYILSETAADVLNHSPSITAVGTTSLRVLETVGRPFVAAEGSTDIFIKPGHRFTGVDSLITNFHLPKSTLLMLVAAFIGSTDELQRIYKYATTEQYRFYSFGDAMLII